MDPDLPGNHLSVLCLAGIGLMFLPVVWGCAEHGAGDTEMSLLSRADTEPALPRAASLGRTLGDKESWEDTAGQVTLTKGIFQTI